MKYYELEPEDNTFTHINIDLTHRCNMECANCYIPNRDIPDMDADKLYEFLKRLPNRIFCRLIGAEATVRSDLPNIIYNTKKCGHKVSLTTNGLKLASKKYTKELKDAGLRMVLLSMNGAHDPDVYSILDGGGEYAAMKVQALKNCMEEKFLINTGTIIAKGVNEFTLYDQVNTVRKAIKETNYNLRLKPLLRFKSIGAIGRHMEESTYTLDELEKQMYWYIGGDNNIQKVDKQPVSTTDYGFYKIEDMYIRLVDWAIDEDGVPDSENEIRGRITPDWKIAPFFEHVKMNEGQF